MLCILTTSHRTSKRVGFNGTAASFLAGVQTTTLDKSHAGGSVPGPLASIFGVARPFTALASHFLWRSFDAALNEAAIRVSYRR